MELGLHQHCLNNYFLVLGFKVGDIVPPSDAQLFDVTVVNLSSLTTIQEESEDNGTAYLQMEGHVVVKLNTLMYMSLPSACLARFSQTSIQTALYDQS